VKAEFTLKINVRAKDSASEAEIVGIRPTRGARWSRGAVADAIVRRRELLLARQLRAKPPPAGQQVRRIEEQCRVASPPRREEQRGLQRKTVGRGAAVPVVVVLNDRAVSEALVRIEVECGQPLHAVARRRRDRYLGVGVY